MKRAPNLVCPKCNRKSLAPEKDKYGWHFPKYKVCFNCTSLFYRVFNQINANRRIKINTVKQANAIFPLLILDITRNVIHAMYGNFSSIRRKLKEYMKEFPNSEIKIIDGKFNNFTDYFLVK